MSALLAAAGIPQPGVHLLVGVGTDPLDGSLRVYLDARYTGRHTHVDDPDARHRIEQAWASAGHHYLDTVPDAALCDCLPYLTPSQVPALLDAWWAA